MNIKYPRYYITDHPSDFYTWYQESKDSRAMCSGWIKGKPELWHKINKMSTKDKNEMIKKLSDKVQ